MIHAVQQRIAINIHPLEKLHYSHIAEYHVLCINMSLVPKTNRFVMGYPIAHVVDNIQCIKDESIVIFKSRCGCRLVWKNVEQTTT